MFDVFASNGCLIDACGLEGVSLWLRSGYILRGADETFWAENGELWIPALRRARRLLDGAHARRRRRREGNAHATVPRVHPDEGGLMSKIEQALVAVTDAATLLNVELIRNADAPIGALDDVVGTLSRAVRRVQVLIAMHPELVREDAAPRGSITTEDLIEHEDTLKALEEAFSLPSVPARIVLRTTVRHDGTIEDLVRESLDGRHVLARPMPTGWYRADVEALAEVVAAALPQGVVEQAETGPEDDTEDKIGLD